jgi:hypothetical protein
MTSDLDICRGAKLLLDRHGYEACFYAAGRVDLLLEEGDVERPRCRCNKRDISSARSTPGYPASRQTMSLPRENQLISVNKMG